MKPIRHRLLVATLLAGIAGTALAQTPPPAAGASAAQASMHRHDPARMHERMQERRARHLAELKQQLKLSPAQEAAWNSFAAALQPPATPPARPDRAELEQLSTPERIDRLMALKAERDQRMHRWAEATKSFYAALTPEQKKLFDDQTLRQFRHGHARGMGPRH